MTEPVEPSRGGSYRETAVLVTVRWTVAVLSGGIPRGVARCSLDVSTRFFKSGQATLSVASVADAKAFLAT
jgi:hypothetical protein